MKIIFEVNEERMNELTWEEMEMLMSNNVVAARPIVARFLMNEAGDEILPHDEAMKFLGKLKLPEIKKAVEAFGKAMKSVAVNPTKEVSS